MATEQKLPVFSAAAIHVALYLQHLGQSKGSKAAVEEAVNAISWAHSMAGLPPPTTDPFIHAVLDVLKRSLVKPINKKEPFTADMLKYIVEDSLEDGSLASIRLATICVITYADFLRYSEVSNIQLSDMDFHPD